MNTRQLEYVLTVAHEKSFSKAAQVLHISQPSLSQYIQRLEDELETQLFDRSSVPLKLTYTGTLFCSTAKECLSLQKQLFAQLKDVANTNSGHISIGVSPYRTTYLLARALHEYRRQYPNIEIELNEQSNYALENLLMEGDVDVAITALPMQNDHLVHKVLFEEKIVLAVPPTGFEHLLPPGADNARLPAVALGLFKDAPFVALSEDYRIYKIMMELCEQAGFSPNIILYCRNIEAVRAMVVEGLGVSLLPYNPYIFSNTRKHPAYYTLNEMFPSREVAVSYKKNRYLSSAAKAFIRILKETLNSSDTGALEETVG